MTMARTYTGNPDLLALRTCLSWPNGGGTVDHRHQPAGAIRACPAMSPSWPEPNQYRGIFGENAGSQPYLDEIDRTIATCHLRQGCRYASIESVQGYGGIIEMPKGYMSGAAERVRAAGVAFISPTRYSRALAALAITCGASRPTASSPISW